MALFKRVYKRTFLCAKEKEQKAITLEMATLYWDVLFSPPGRPWVTASVDWKAMWIEYLTKNWNKSVNKDMWNQTFEFFLKTMEDETLSFWSEDSAWPGVIDDFVLYTIDAKKGNRGDKMETD